MLYFVYLTAWRCCFLHLIKQNCLLQTFLRTLMLISLPVFPSRTDLKLHNICLTHKMVKQVIANLHSSKASSPDSMPMVVPMLEFLKALFLVLHFSYYTLMIFLVILSAILLSMLMTLLSILSVIRHLICGNRQNWLLNLNLIWKALDWGRKWLVDFNAAKTYWFSLTDLITRVLLI